MKLRIRGNSIRLRLNKTEVTGLAETGLVEEKTDFGDGQMLVYSVSALSETETVKSSFQNGRIEIFIPQTIAKNWAKNEEVGISGNNILVEKDFACLAVREGEDESDNFPHPKENEISC